MGGDSVERLGGVDPSGLRPCCEELRDRVDQCGSILRADEAVVGALFRTVGCAPSLLEPVRERGQVGS